METAHLSAISRNEKPLVDAYRKVIREGFQNEESFEEWCDSDGLYIVAARILCPGELPESTWVASANQSETELLWKFFTSALELEAPAWK
jgi:hypothetical protein